MRRLLFTYFGSNDAPNGASSFSKQFIQSKKVFKENGWDLKYFTSTGNALNGSAATITNNNEGILKHLLLSIARYSLVISILCMYLMYLRHAKKVIKNADFTEGDTIIFNDIFTFYYYSLIKVKTKNVLILHCDGDPFKMLLEKLPGLKKFGFSNHLNNKFIKLLNKIDNVILLSNLAKDLFLELYGNLISANKCTVISNGIPRRELEEQPLNKYFDNKIRGVAIGTINYRKGYDILIKALSQLEDNENIEINCIGTIESDEILSLKRRSGVKGVDFVGVKNKNQIEDYLKRADFFILCSRDEGLPISIIEAMRENLPIFSTNVGGIPEMVNSGETGILFEPKVNDVRNILLSIIENKYDLIKMGKNSKALFENKFSLDIMLDKYINVINKINV